MKTHQGHLPHPRSFDAFVNEDWEELFAHANRQDWDLIARGWIRFVALDKDGQELWAIVEPVTARTGRILDSNCQPVGTLFRCPRNITLKHGSRYWVAGSPETQIDPRRLVLESVPASASSRISPAA